MADFLDRIGRALLKLGESLITPDDTAPARERSIEETEPMFPHAQDTGSIFEDHGTDDPSDFPSWWGPAEYRLWEVEPQTYKPFYDEYPSQWRDLIRAFDKGWVIRKGRSASKETRDAAREDFYDRANMTKSSFDWIAYRAYLAEVGS